MAQGRTEQEWNQVMELFHKLWGQCKDGVYDKPTWNGMHRVIYSLREQITGHAWTDSDPEALYIVRLWDMFDGWIDLTPPLPKSAAEKIWNERTENGTKKTKYDDGDYYRIFPADTKMVVTPEALGR